MLFGIVRIQKRWQLGKFSFALFFHLNLVGLFQSDVDMEYWSDISQKTIL